MKIHMLLVASWIAANHAQAALSGSDDFNDNSLDSSKWSLIADGFSTIKEIHSRLEFSPLSNTQSSSQSMLVWVKNTANANSTWEITLDLANSYAPSINPFDASDYLRGATVALAVSGGAGSLSVGFSTEKLQGFGVSEYFHGLSCQFSGEDESTDIDLSGNSAAVRITYNKETGLLSAYYDSNGPVGGYTWSLMKSSSISSWGLSPGQPMGVSISTGYSGSKPQAPAAGNLQADNFKATSSNKPPTISLIPNQQIPINSTTGKIPFSIDDSDTPVKELVVTATSSNPSLLPVANISITGSGEQRYVAATPTLGRIGTATVTLIVSDGTDTAEEPFQLIVISSGGSAPDIAVEQPVGSTLVSGVTKKSFGTIEVGSSGNGKTFTILNKGGTKLTGLAITKGGTQKGDFIVSQPAKTSLAPKASTTFKVSFKPSGRGTRSAVLHIKSNDPDENPFDVKVTGAGASP